ncbi:MAG: phosphodiester glycosidase family protein [Flavobacteriaceae bacterium]|jgi:uncharacterized protein YigE (DUF2233 family)|nr:phosphodiester glycosidase family protein [Flavobacteriaceae bacterium]
MKNFGIVMLLFFVFFACQEKQEDKDYVIYEVNPKEQPIMMYWKDGKGSVIRSLGNLKEVLANRNEKLVFAMNGGMFEPNNAPKGLYIEKDKQLQAIDTLVGGAGNFYLQPNGVFYLTKENQAQVVSTTLFQANTTIKYATQSGPMLLVDGQVNKVFTPGSTNLNIRNGVGVKPTGEVVFALSKKKVNFYDFALFFQKMGCTNALYLDGFVSRAYLPSKNWKQTDGDFGVLIAVSEKRE